jgi:uncharacterized peroxidase-related enzyme
VRLGILEHGQSGLGRAAMALARTLGRSELDPVVKTSLYRPVFFGRAWIALVRDVLRGPSPWSPAERELFGAYVSYLNRCRFCAAVHSRVAGLGLGTTVTDELLANWREAGLDRRIRLTMGMLEKAVEHPDQLGPEDMDALRAGGVTDQAIVDALHVAFVFCLINRVANALGFSWNTEADMVKGARILRRLGYRLPSFLLR